MQKPKRKIGQQTFWQKFYDRYILLHHDFRYEIDETPEEFVTNFELYCLERNYDYWYTHLSIKKALGQELWNLELDNSRFALRGIDAELVAQIYQKEDKTILEGSTTVHETQLLFYIRVAILCLIIGLLLAMASEQAFSLTALLIFLAFVILLSKLPTIHRQEKLYEFIENFLEQENYGGKLKNEELSPEILKEKRK